MFRDLVLVAAILIAALVGCIQGHETDCASAIYGDSGCP